MIISSLVLLLLPLYQTDSDQFITIKVWRLTCVEHIQMCKVFICPANSPDAWFLVWSYSSWLEWLSTWWTEYQFLLSMHECNMDNINWVGRRRDSLIWATLMKGMGAWHCNGLANTPKQWKSYRNLCCNAIIMASTEYIIAMNLGIFWHADGFGNAIDVSGVEIPYSFRFT